MSFKEKLIIKINKMLLSADMEKKFTELIVKWSIIDDRVLREFLIYILIDVSSSSR